MLEYIDRSDIYVIEPSDGYLINDMDDSHVEFTTEAFKKYRAIWFKGFNLNVDQFTKFCDLFCTDYSDYKGGGSRWKAINREVVNNDKTLLTATGSVQNFTIPLHGEMYYMDNPPELIFFYCQTPATKGGETILCNGQVLLRSLDAETRQFFTENKIKYKRYLPDGDWQVAFMIDDYDALKEFCIGKGMTIDRDENNAVITEYVSSPILYRENIKENVFINNILYIYFAEQAFKEGGDISKIANGAVRCPIVVRMENDEEIPYKYIERLMAEASKAVIDIRWQTGDFVMVDNHIVMHGRKKSPGDERKLLVKMGSAKFKM